MTAAKWTPGVPSVSVAAGTVTASVPLLDSGVLAATVTFTLTGDRMLLINVRVEPGSAGLAGFQAWSNT